MPLHTTHTSRQSIVTSESRLLHRHVSGTEVLAESIIAHLQTEPDEKGVHSRLAEFFTEIADDKDINEQVWKQALENLNKKEWKEIEINLQKFAEQSGLKIKEHEELLLLKKALQSEPVSHSKDKKNKTKVLLLLAAAATAIGVYLGISPEMRQKIWNTLQDIWTWFNRIVIGSIVTAATWVSWRVSRFITRMKKRISTVYRAVKGSVKLAAKTARGIVQPIRALASRYFGSSAVKVRKVVRTTQAMNSTEDILRIAAGANHADFPLTRFHPRLRAAMDSSPEFATAIGRFIDESDDPVNAIKAISKAVESLDSAKDLSKAGKEAQLLARLLKQASAAKKVRKASTILKILRALKQIKIK